MICSRGNGKHSHITCSLGCLLYPATSVCLTFFSVCIINKLCIISKLENKNICIVGGLQWSAWKSFLETDSLDMLNGFQHAFWCHLLCVFKFSSELYHFHPVAAHETLEAVIKRQERREMAEIQRRKHVRQNSCNHVLRLIQLLLVILPGATPGRGYETREATKKRKNGRNGGAQPFQRRYLPLYNISPIAAENQQSCWYNCLKIHLY